MMVILKRLAYLFWFFPILILFGLPDLVMENPWQTSYPWQQTLLACGLIVLAVSLTYALAKKWGYVHFDQAFFSWKTVGMLTASYLVSEVVGNFCYLWLEELGKSGTVNDMGLMEVIAKQPPIFVCLSMTLLPAVIEEVLCRGLLMTKLFGRNSWSAILVSSLIFAGLHGPTDFPSWVIYFFPGLIMGYLYKRTGNLAYPMALHFLNNGLATLYYYF